MSRAIVWKPELYLEPELRKRGLHDPLRQAGFCLGCKRRLARFESSGGDEPQISITAELGFERVDGLVKQTNTAASRGMAAFRAQTKLRTAARSPFAVSGFIADAAAAAGEHPADWLRRTRLQGLTLQPGDVILCPGRRSPCLERVEITIPR